MTEGAPSTSSSWKRITNHPILRTFITLTWLSGLLYLVLYAIRVNQNAVHRTLSLDGVYIPAPGPRGDLMLTLGFVPEPKLYPQSHHQGTELPVFVIAISSSDVFSFHKFLGSFRIYFRDKRLVVYNLGLTAKEKTLIRQTCQCVVRDVHWERYPDHVKDFSTNVFRPFLIQETLNEFGAVFWCHPAMRFNSSNLDPLTRLAEHHGIIAWSIRSIPTSSVTHLHTFRYLLDEPSSFYYHHMAEPDMTLYYNTYRLHHKLMMPWVKCALDTECFAPRAARSRGCHLEKPRYLYSGCHLYDTSVFNVLLGQMFHYETPYLGEKPIFQLQYVKNQNGN